jgi:hypothetical protein
MKQTLCEYNPIRCQVLSEGKDAKGDPVLKVLVKWQQAEKINGNKRRYRRALLEREIARLSPMMKNGEVWGSAYHPEDGIGKVGDITHSWDKIWIEPNGECFGEISVLPTSAGKDLQIILRKGRIGMSSRGKGTLTHKSETIDGAMQEFDDVNEDYFCLSPGDFVLGASVDDAGPVRILEQEMNLEREGKVEEDAEMEEFLENASDEELDVMEFLADLGDAEFDQVMNLPDEEFEEYLKDNYFAKLGEQIINNPLSLTEEFISLDKAIRDAVKDTFGDAAWVKDFSQDSIIFTAQNPGSPDVLLMVGYLLFDDGIEFVGDPVIVNRTEDYEEVVTESLKTKVQKSLPRNENLPFGELSAEELRNSGYTKRFSPPDLKLSENENKNALSPSDRILLRKKSEK